MRCIDTSTDTCNATLSSMDFGTSDLGNQQHYHSINHLDQDQTADLSGPINVSTLSTYQLNRSPSSAIGYKTPAIFFYGNNDLSRLKVFSSKTYAVKLPKGSKLEERSNETILVGYSPNGYRL
jgi:hypothetical protein